MSLNYRPDIDGLRAVAVIPVILFHANIALFSGGYVGVDIFFVISGYLITNILLGDIQQNNFSVFTFYERRIRRIFPALFTVLIVSSGIALWIMLPSELKAYGESLLAATAFYSNYYFMFDSGYFASPAETKPLLHIWSLAVEEQFYIVFPIYLYLVSHFYKNKLCTITVLMLFISLLYSIVLVYISPDDAFYSAPSRAWELMAGSVLAIYPRRVPLDSKTAHFFSSIGLGVIVYSIFFYTKETPFPGTMALLPVIGTALIIYAGAANKNMVGALLATKGFRFFGLISFSLYLWHWPVLTFYKMYKIVPVSDIEIVIILLVIVALSYLSWRFVETPFRRRQLLSKQKIIIFTGCGMLLITALCSIIIIVGDGFPARFPNKINQIMASSTDRPTMNECENINTKLRVCQIGSITEKKATFAVWGDSHGESLFPGINNSAKNFNIKGVFVGRGGCVTLLGVYQARQGYESCVDEANAFMSYLLEHPEIKQVILVSRWALYMMGNRFKNEKGHTVYIKDIYTESLSLDENRRVFTRSFERTLEKLSSLGRQVIFVMQLPETEWNIPLDVARAKILNRNIEFKPKISDYLSRQASVVELIEKYKGKHALMVVRPDMEMCAKDFCTVLDNDVPIYRDSNHITKTYAVQLSKIFNPIFSDIKVSKLASRMR